MRGAQMGQGKRETGGPSTAHTRGPSRNMEGIVHKGCDRSRNDVLVTPRDPWPLRMPQLPCSRVPQKGKKVGQKIWFLSLFFPFCSRSERNLSSSFHRDSKVKGRKWGYWQRCEVCVCICIMTRWGCLLIFIHELTTICQWMYVGKNSFMDAWRNV